MKRRRRKLPLKACDPRVNAPMISWHIIFVVLGVIALLVALMQKIDNRDKK